jgi:tetratricopeptide (TPR) repeat protein
LRETIQLDPSYYRPYFFLGEILWGVERLQDALLALRQAQERAPRNLEVIAGIGSVQARMGDHAAARATLDRLVETAGPQFDPSLFCALIHTALGDMDSAFGCVESAIERRFNPIYLLRFRWFKALGHDSRYQSCLRRIGLPTVNAAAGAR